MLSRYAFALALLATTPALAQGDPAAMGRSAAANQLGVLEFCQSNGDVGDDAIAAEKDVISRTPGSATPTDSAEALGKQGTFASPNGQQITLTDVAAKQNTTVSAMCKQMANSTLQADAMMKQNSGMGLMPAMPTMPSGMTSVPGMPGGMPTMPTMPGGMPTASGLTAVPGLPANPAVPGR